MSPDGRDLWPASWPPFRRDVLHVAVAVGVGNLAQAIGMAVGVLSEGNLLYENASFVLAFLTLPLSVGLYARMVRCNHATMVGLLAATVLGNIVMTAFLFAVGLLGIPFGMALAVLLFAAFIPGSRRLPMLAVTWGVGTLLSIVACYCLVLFGPNGEFHACKECGGSRPEVAFHMFVASLSGYVLFPLTYVIVAKLFILAAHDFQPKEKPPE